MWELMAVANWILSFTLYLEMLQTRPQQTPAHTNDTSIVAPNTTTHTPAKGVKNVYGNVREQISVKSLRREVAHTDPNLGYLQKEVAKARTVNSCSNRGDQIKRRVLKETLAGQRVVLDPLELDDQVRAVVVPPKLAFGSLREGARYAQELTLTNMGQLAVRFNVKRMKSTVQEKVSDIVSFVYPKGPVAPGMTCRIQVVVSAAQVIPDLDEVIEIVTETACMRVPITASVRPGSSGGSLEVCGMGGNGKMKKIIFFFFTGKERCEDIGRNKASSGVEAVQCTTKQMPLHPKF